MRTSILCVLALITLSTPLTADTTRTQVLPLKSGWNAIYLEVQPPIAKPDLLFAGLPIETVAAFFPGRLQAQYLRSPGDAPWREEGWATWHAPSKADAIVSNLHQIQALRSYLVFATRDFLWNVSGEARMTRLEWYPNTCTFTGLPVDPEAPPTFSAFFEASSAHQRLRIFRLEAGNWKLVQRPATEKPRAGEAYWIETDGGSAYQGPLTVEVPRTAELDFGAQGGARTLGFVNASSKTTSRIRITQAASAGSPALPLQRVQRDLTKLSDIATALPADLQLPMLLPGSRTSLRLDPDRDTMTAVEASTLLRIADGRGTLFWLPTRASRGAASQVAGQP